MKSVDFQRKVFQILSCLSLTRHYIIFDSKCQKKDNLFLKYTVQLAGPLSRAAYYLCILNCTLKMTYLFLLSTHLVDAHVGFLDQISIGNYFICATMWGMEVLIWYRKYPLFEILGANWKLQQTIFRKLGSPGATDEELLRKFMALLLKHTYACYSSIH